jgi:hypothetical protein
VTVASWRLFGRWSSGSQRHVVTIARGQDPALARPHPGDTLIDGEIVPQPPDPAAQRRDILTADRQQLKIPDALQE